jgi:ankyrin repeat protein
LSSGLDINLLDRYGRTPLHIASLLGGEALVEKFANKMSPKEIGIGGFTALHPAGGNEAIVRTLLERMPPEQLGLVNSRFSTAPDESVRNRPSRVTDLSPAMMRPEDISGRNVSGRTVLHLVTMNKGDEAVAAGANFPDIVEALLARGEAVHFAIRDETGQIALYLAAERGHIEVVQQLLDHIDLDDVVGCDNGGETALHKAAKRGYRAIVELLLQSYPDDEDVTATNTEGETALDSVGAFKHRCVVSLIEERLRGGAA